MAVNLLVLQHTPWEGPGSLLVSMAKKLKVVLRVVKVWKDSYPSLGDYDGLLVLGGGPNVDQEDRYPFLVEEKKFIRQAMAEDMPYLGFCLGHQLLADALGAKVGPNICPSIGFVQGHLTHDGREHPAFKHLPKAQHLFKWHAQAVLQPVPKNVTVLMTSEECQVEALSVADRPHIMGVQFDNHAASINDVATWLNKDQKWLSSLPGLEVSSAAILASARKYEKVIADEFETFFANFVGLVESIKMDTVSCPS